MEREVLHLAWSINGRHFQALDGNRPTWADRWLRDLFVGRGHDGHFHLLATGPHDEDGKQHSCVYGVSKDLIS